MTAIQETAYPRLKSSPSSKDLKAIYTPTSEELELARKHTKNQQTFLCFLVLLKTYQRLGYSIPIAITPPKIIQHICKIAQTTVSSPELRDYDCSKSRTRHLAIIRGFLDIKAYGKKAAKVVHKTMMQAATTLQDYGDLINVALEELIRQRFELPGFTTLERMARKARKAFTEEIYKRILKPLKKSNRKQLDALFVVEDGPTSAPWNDLKQEPGRPTLGELKDLIERLNWIASLRPQTDVLADIPEAKIKQLAAEARSLDIAQMKRLAPEKRYALSLAFLARQHAQALDDLAEIFIKRMNAMHRKGADALQLYRKEQQERTDTLISTLKDLVIAFNSDADLAQRLVKMAAVIHDYGQTLIEDCDAHLDHTGNNYLPFLRQYYSSHRASLFRLLEVVPLHSTTQDTRLMDAMAFIQAHRTSRKLWIATDASDATLEDADTPPLILTWISNPWWSLVTGQSQKRSVPTQVHRHYLELCVFSQLLLELQSGDIYIEGSSEYHNYYSQLLPWEECEAQLADYSQRMKIPTDGKAFVNQLRQYLIAVTKKTDQAFPRNTQAQFEQDKLVIRRPKRVHIKGLSVLKQEIEKRIQPINLLDILGDTQQWLNWTQFFKPLSGNASRIANPIARYIATTFCYGCGLGPSQLSRSLKNFNPRQLFRVNQGHVTTGTLQKAINVIIDGYNKFDLPKLWGSGKHASVDGTKWDIYEQNLLAEYHIRYGGYGGIGYYHVSDTYIALFSHFIPCGVYEAIYMLNGLHDNPTQIRPDTIHGDTHSQSCTVFGLSYLLGIKLMPRIRRWKHLVFYRPSRSTRYKHIDSLFTEVIDWKLIEQYLPDMLRVVLSIKAGKVSPSTILRKLGTKSHKNKLFQAFHALGCVLRTGFLMEYINDVDLRQLIQGATNKSETFNAFIKWICFGGDGVLATNNREEQRKRIRYSHLVANCLIFYNVSEMSRILNELNQEGFKITPEAVKALSPYIRKHINRLGQYLLNLARIPGEINYDLPIQMTLGT
ncbi:Tn3 family transposase [Acaryochloris sp. CCMEE 5410]|uniref:Tn3 family transposase n=1 Tax=Acaryochloris sp. CCMEE 5410 TaxID=310037 RepID=UPI0002483876|nr:Tn3 family transposase [Acaryochloris sp. CCMEE 5410]KAI9129140.1 Tn3 family transposase [Acaryochloris sp. CCMEE 5410]